MNKLLIGLITVTCATGCNAADGKNPEVDKASKVVVCTVQYRTSRHFALNPGEIPFTNAAEQFCRWKKGGFVAQVNSDQSCRDAGASDTFTVERVTKTAIAESAHLCDGVERYQLLSEVARDRMTELGSNSSYGSIALEYDPTQIESLDFEIVRSKQRDGFPIKAIFYNQTGALLFVEPQFNPWGDKLCEALQERFSARYAYGNEIRWVCEPT